MAKDLKITVLLDFYGEMLTDNQRELMEQYYNDDLSLSEISSNEGITRQGVRDGVKRGEQQLYELEEKLHFAEWSSRIKALARQIHASAEDILSGTADAAEGAAAILTAAEEMIE